jgi:hypothetical protein
MRAVSVIFPYCISLLYCILACCIAQGFPLKPCSSNVSAASVPLHRYAGRAEGGIVIN